MRVAVAALLTLWAIVPAATVGAAEAARPNVLFIAVDDLNDWIGALGGHPQVKTPNLDRLAARGVVFERAYCAAPACNPSRTALMTGIRPSTSGVYVNGQPWRPVMSEAVTLTQHFIAHGYEVHGGGKIYHSGSLKSIFNDEASWQRYFDRPADPHPEKAPLNGINNAAHFDWGPLSATNAEMADTQVANWAIDYLEQKRSGPFFLAVGFFRPHLPWYVPEEYFQQYPLGDVTLPTVKEDDLDDVPPAGVRMAKPEGDHKNVISTNNWARAVQGYLASITYADRQVGRLLDTLERSPYAGNTIIVLWGDHGWHLGQKQHWRKFALWEEATRVPLIFVVPAVTQPGSRSPRTVSLLDVYPTLVDLCGLPAVAACEGRSLRPLLADPQAAWERPVLTTHGRENHAVRSERWRYIRYRDGSEELYDHQKDPLEWTNLAGRPEYASIKQDLARWLPEVNAADVPDESHYRQGGAKKGGAKPGKTQADAPRKG